jgi:diketogulonate reductase-like aldo/keto reductase
VNNRFQNLPFKCNLQRYITVVAYSPLGFGELLQEPAVAAAAARLGGAVQSCLQAPGFNP